MTIPTELAIKLANRARAEDVDEIMKRLYRHGTAPLASEIRDEFRDQLTAAYDSHDRAIAELEARLAGARNDALREVADNEGQQDWAFSENLCAAILTRLTQPDRSQERQAVIEATRDWFADHDAGHYALYNAVQRLQSAESPSPGNSVVAG